MLDYLRGNLAHIETDYIVLDVNGMGYRVFCSNPYEFQMDKELQVFIHQHVREDAILLYGFKTREEQTLFRRLIDVSGIGPRVAVGILSGATPQNIITSIQQENITFLTKLPGIGKKTAQRVILDLKDKLDHILSDTILVDNKTAVSLDQSDISMPAPWIEAKEALIGLGYSEKEVDKAWEDIRGKVDQHDTVEIIMKKALQSLFEG
ncbi:Holliday junction branch migration protein RuvA [Chengkuizengella axinellae]|uniref:Holliday junction branch migration complex subunit RuvA n=1 Tax=Chengkuizengella axinellae TaxID=3064388 RepID=A0ABT9IV89_9BACL|nr:Holliday junction branch migration protein RuvA [Chengkuizengella sp. 2205SS18-9]MDP5272759.1 Holliday junction branch migration protein RuvA [Chengkuizengella sp. 2205SS18-9]